ncbi:SPI-2 type III secretion system protein SpiC [Kosakonia sp. BYX6]|uniref:SPI-2 type III secretion system protein SpiC n=1 Tax=Kosakonia calanthes TaxID=3139408 RepID=A0ABZ3B4M5_9ENTR
MLETLKAIPLVCDIRSDDEHRGWIMSVDGHPARMEIIRGLLSVSLFLDGVDRVSWSCLYYLTLLLAAHPDIHDYALQLTPEGGWLNRYYPEQLSVDQLSMEIEKHLALTCYLKNAARNHQSCCFCEDKL